MSHLDANALWIISVALGWFLGILAFGAWAFRNDRTWRAYCLAMLFAAAGGLALAAYLGMGGAH